MLPMVALVQLSRKSVLASEGKVNVSATQKPRTSHMAMPRTHLTSAVAKAGRGGFSLAASVRFSSRGSSAEWLSAMESDVAMEGILSGCGVTRPDYLEPDITKEFSLPLHISVRRTSRILATHVTILVLPRSTSLYCLLFACGGQIKIMSLPLFCVRSNTKNQVHIKIRSGHVVRRRLSGQWSPPTVKSGWSPFLCVDGHEDSYCHCS